MTASSRGFVLRHTRLRPVKALEKIRLHLADEVLPLWRAVQVETADPDAALPYWAFAWGGGLALGRYLGEHPDAVAGRRVFDLASGSGLCAIAAMRAGAAAATAVDIDAFAVAAIELNARANGQRIAVVRRDVLDDDPPDSDVILAGDCWYEAGLAERVLPWLRR
ncbi:MAG: class I SAM-dependent methyltransferase, partial [Candidatus Limnocylindrales bacterium]